MRAILPGRPQSKRQALSTAHWDGLRLVTYISGNAAVILTGPQTILQTIYVDSVEDLVAVTIDESSGRIALCDEDNVYIYKPLGREDGVLRWVQVQELDNPPSLKLTSLSWGSNKELLLGGSRLVLWYLPLTGDPILTWNQVLAYPTAIAYISPDSGLIASVGSHDRLVKIWRRLSFEADGTRFDVSYLPHPTAVTNLHWRKPWHVEQNLDNLLYTFCADNHIRVWTPFDPHALDVLQQVGTINMKASIQPRRLSVGSVSRKRYAFIIDSRDFSKATEGAVQGSNPRSADHALEHLIEIANRSPEVCVVLDGMGHMSVWGLEHAGYKNRIPPSVFHISHVDGMDIRIPQLNDPLDDYVQFCIFAGGVTPSSLSLLLHSYAGDVDWYDGQITHLFDTANRSSRAHLICSLAGHSAPIKRLVRNVRGTVLLSVTDEDHASLWQHEGKQSSAPLLRRSSFRAGSGARDAVVMSRGRYAVILNSHGLELWDVREAKGKQLGSLALSGNLPDRITQSRIASDRALTSRVVIGYFPDGSVEAWEFLLPADDGRRSRLSNGFPEIIRSLGEVKLRVYNKYNSLVSICDNMNSNDRPEESQIANSLAFTAAVAKEGIVELIQSNEEVDSSKPRLEAGSLLETNVLSPSALGVNGQGKVVMINEDGTSLTIWDANTGIWEYEHDLDGTDTIKTFAWAVSPQGHVLLAVCYDYHIVVLGQIRYTYPAHRYAWVDLRHIRIRDHTNHSIGDVCWLKSGDLVVGSGIQLFVFEGFARSHHNEESEPIKSLPRNLESGSAFTVLSTLNSILPVYHPTYLSLLTSIGRFKTVKDIIHRLHKDMKFFAEGDDLPSFLNFELSSFASDGHQRTINSTAHHGLNGDTNGDIDGDLIADISTKLTENLEKHTIRELEPSDKSRLCHSIKTFGELERHANSVDSNGQQFLQALYNSERKDVPWSAIALATRSTSQEILINLVTTHHGGKLTWDAARSSGLFCWASDLETLRTQMENVARTEYTKHEDRNPVDCSLYYLALGKKNVLLGLWRMAVGVAEKPNTLKLLSNDFEEPRWRATALKNAYALISKRRFHYAAAFFLLGGDLWGAVNVCVHQIQDLQLAVAIARVYEDQPGTPTLQRLIKQVFLPRAITNQQGRWMATWAYSLLGEPALAMQAIVHPLHTAIGKALCDMDETDPIESLNYAANDPVLTVLYLELRTQFIKQNRWRGIISQKDEWDFVMRCVRQYLRMGCDAMALALVRDWMFVDQSKEIGFSEDNMPPKEPGIQKRKTFIDLEKQADEEDEQVQKAVREETFQQQQPVKKPPPTQFQEPSADSLLDSFGF
ncbi:hypothetical protein PV10_02525 [Exophiala mesophila]|uniref:RAVE complex protein Rav1 C-terminal domain-containing protein n=1 Tax=Exophiala mesophila TaxID=212818 RepID=A0A0D2A6Y4_EXOME|nr:uncharacterized protein PV10_02525 [Exophiala mesophila]KIV94793.1 hypothetical protein PV10_02525 [Exophiala mesophila]